MGAFTARMPWLLGPWVSEIGVVCKYQELCQGHGRVGVVQPADENTRPLAVHLPLISKLREGILSLWKGKLISRLLCSFVVAPLNRASACVCDDLYCVQGWSCIVARLASGGQFSDSRFPEIISW